MARISTFLGMAIAHIALLFEIIAFATIFWLEGKILYHSQLYIKVNFGLVGSYYEVWGQEKNYTTREVLRTLSEGKDAYKVLYVTIILESISLVLTLISVLLFYFVVIKQYIRILWATMGTFIVGGILGIVASAHFQQTLREPGYLVKELQIDFGYSCQLGLASGCLGIVAAGFLAFAFLRGETKREEA